MVTSCATQCWCLPVSTPSTQRKQNMLQKETNRRLKSSTTSQIWTTLLLTGTLVKSALWPPSTRRYAATSQSESRRDHGVASSSAMSRPGDRTRPSSRETVSAESITCTGCMATPFLLKKWRPKPFTKLDKGHSEFSFQDSQRIVRSKPRSARGSQVLGARVQSVLLEQTFLARLDNLIEGASTVFLDALDGNEKPTAQLYMQKAAQAADEAWQQIAQGHDGPTIAKPTVAEVEQSDTTSQHEDDGDEITYVPARKRRLHAPHLRAQLSRLSDRTRLRR